MDTDIILMVKKVIDYDNFIYFVGELYDYYENSEDNIIIDVSRDEFIKYIKDDFDELNNIKTS